MREMGRRYLSTLLMMFFQRVLVKDDLLAERLANNQGYQRQVSELESRLDNLEQRLDAMHPEGRPHEIEQHWAYNEPVGLIPRGLVRQDEARR
jgi:hypothetical protein